MASSSDTTSSHECSNTDCRRHKQSLRDEVAVLHKQNQQSRQALKVANEKLAIFEERREEQDQSYTWLIERLSLVTREYEALKARIDITETREDSPANSTSEENTDDMTDLQHRKIVKETPKKVARSNTPIGSSFSFPSMAHSPVLGSSPGDYSYDISGSNPSRSRKRTSEHISPPGTQDTESASKTRASPRQKVGTGSPVSRRAGTQSSNQPRRNLGLETVSGPKERDVHSQASASKQATREVGMEIESRPMAGSEREDVPLHESSHQAETAFSTEQTLREVRRETETASIISSERQDLRSQKPGYQAKTQASAAKEIHRKSGQNTRSASNLVSKRQDVQGRSHQSETQASSSKSVPGKSGKATESGSTAGASRSVETRASSSKQLPRKSGRDTESGSAISTEEDTIFSYSARSKTTRGELENEPEHEGPPGVQVIIANLRQSLDSVTTLSPETKESLRKQLPLWDKAAPGWEERKTKSVTNSCIDAISRKLASRWFHVGGVTGVEDRNHACQSCTKMERVCAVLHKPGILTILPTKED